MKDTFFNLNGEKQKRIIGAVLEEFALSGYEKTSLDAIIHRAGISKGGLYEYIESKEELFQYALTHAYSEMYAYIQARISERGIGLPPDPLARTRIISAVAVDFYIAQPEIIAFIVNSSQVGQAEIRARVQGVFDSYFLKLYETAENEGIVFEGNQVLSLLKWLLIKTRNDFLEKMREGGGSAVCKEAYLAEWNFFLSVLESGIYGGGAIPSALK
jgi:AcrR family transcriptional regulator